MVDLGSAGRLKKTWPIPREMGGEIDHTDPSGEKRMAVDVAMIDNIRGLRSRLMRQRHREARSWVESNKTAREDRGVDDDGCIRGKK